jgi:hypothetical protein
VLVEPSCGFAGGSLMWRAQGRRDLPLAAFPAQAAQLANLRRRAVTIAGFEVRPIRVDRLDGSPEVALWRALDRRGRIHDADTPEAAAVAAGAHITLDPPSQ